MRRRGGRPPDHDVRMTELRERLRTGFWFVPLVAVLGAWSASAALHRLDVALGGDTPAALAYDGDSAQAAEVLSTIAGSILTFTGIVFSITAVALQLGSSQFSPRALRNFLRDRLTQYTLAILVATFTYSLLTLRYVDPSTAPGTPGPGLSVSMALVLVISSLVVFVFFVDHLAQSIRVVSIIERVARETRATVREIYPLEDPGPEPDLPARPPDQVVRWERGPGVIVGFDEDDLVDVARQAGVVLRFATHVGDYVPSGVPVIEVWGVLPGDGDHDRAPRPAGDVAGLAPDGRPNGHGDGRGRRGAGDDELVPPAQVLRQIGVGIERTMVQDPLFGLRQLVDIAEKALSPALNDPTTAVQSLDRIHDLLRRIATRPLPNGTYTDDDGVVRVVLPVATWNDVVHMACDEIRIYGAHSIQVTRRLRAMLDDLLTVAAPDRAGALRTQVELLDRAVQRAFVDPADRVVAGCADEQGMGT